jgi:hypothetical protein
VSFVGAVLQLRRRRDATNNTWRSVRQAVIKANRYWWSGLHCAALHYDNGTLPTHYNERGRRATVAVVPVRAQDKDNPRLRKKAGRLASR